MIKWTYDYNDNNKDVHDFDKCGTMNKHFKIRCDHVLSKSSWIFKNVFKAPHFVDSPILKKELKNMLNYNNKMTYIILLQQVM